MEKDTTAVGLAIAYISLLVIYFGCSICFAAVFRHKLTLILKPQTMRDPGTFDTYCVLSLRLMRAGFIFAITCALQCATRSIIYAISLYEYLTLCQCYDSERERVAYSMLRGAQVISDLIIPHRLCYGVLVAFVYSEWMAMWFLMRVQKAASVDELLFDHANPIPR